MPRKQLQGSRLVYGADPWAIQAGEELALLVLDHATCQLLRQMSTARTWGDAFAGFTDRLEKENQARWESEQPPWQSDDPFDIAEHSEGEGLVHDLIVESEFTAARAIADIPEDSLLPLLDNHVRFESGMVELLSMLPAERRVGVSRVGPSEDDKEEGRVDARR